jgi:hypothetical protein
MVGAHLYVPSDFYLLEEGSESWVPTHRLPHKVKCWTEEGFMTVSIERCTTHDRVNHYANIDAVTTLGIDNTCIEAVHVNYHWMPPWVTRDGDKNILVKCNEIDHKMKALSDFLPHKTCKLDANFIDCKLPRLRYQKLKDMKNMQSITSLISHTEGRFQIVRVPNKGTSLCESSLCATSRKHALAYINMVLSIKGIKVPKSTRLGDHTEIKDRGLRLSGAAFRRFRRLLTSCSVRNSYIPRVYRLRDGRPIMKRRLRLQLDSDGIARCVDVKEKIQHATEFHCIMKTLPTNHTAELVSIGRDTFPVTWYKVTLSKGASIAIEGVMIRLTVKK